jgi:hypothetical protein
VPPQASGFFFAVPFSQASVVAVLVPPACAGLRGSPSDNLHASLSERQTYLKILDIRLPVLALFQTKSGISLKYRRFERNPSCFDNQHVGWHQYGIVRPFQGSHFAVCLRSFSIVTACLLAPHLYAFGL